MQSLFNAEKRPNVTQEELDNLREHIELINYSIMELESNEERAHGQWQGKPYVSLCSVCGKWIAFAHGDMVLNYCPNCGAKMDGDSEC
jgi:predicted RNA-binding Zn-ribbon protein involved in translation (DUF1610 family)